jgi:hypothetical protein
VCSSELLFLLRVKDGTEVMIWISSWEPLHKATQRALAGSQLSLVWGKKLCSSETVPFDLTRGQRLDTEECGTCSGPHAKTGASSRLPMAGNLKREAKIPLIRRKYVASDVVQPSDQSEAIKNACPRKLAQMIQTAFLPVPALFLQAACPSAARCCWASSRGMSSRHGLYK